MSAFSDGIDKAAQETQPRTEPAGKATITPDGGTFTGVTTDKPLETSKDWSEVFERFNMDPDAFEILNDTVTMTVTSKRWQQSKRLENGDRDTIELTANGYTYGARFRRKVATGLTEAELADHRAALRNWQRPKVKYTKPSDEIPCTAVVNLSDMQAFKSEGGGIAGLTQRLSDGLENAVNWIERMQRSGRNIEGICLVNGGDPYEGVDGNYASQLFTVQGNVRAQMNYVLDVWAMYGRELFPRFAKADWVSVLCNHTELSRLGGSKNRTGDSDSGGSFLSEAYRRILDGRPEYAHVNWTIPHDEFNVFATLSGVPCGFTHGHKIPGNDATGFERWLNGQARGDERAHQAKVWFTNHRHNLQLWDLGSAVVVQNSSSDGGSKWLRDMNGKFSHSGITAALVGQHDRLRLTDLVML